jgi:hypothetical protein
MDNFKLVSESRNDAAPSNQLISEKSNNQIEPGIEQVGNLPYKSAAANMLDEVSNHFKTTFSNVSKGEASTSEYLEVGALVVGTAALAAVGVGKLMQRTFPTLKSTIAEEGFLISKDQGARAIPVDRLLRASEHLPHPASSRVFASSTSIGRGEAAISPIARSEGVVIRGEPIRTPIGQGDAAVFPMKPISRTSPPGPLADLEHRINASWNVPVKDRTLTITNEKLAELVPRLEKTPSRKLTLNFEGSQISDDGLAHLLPLRGRIQELNLAGTRITEEGRYWLSRNFPGARIVIPSQRETKVNALAKTLAEGTKVPTRREMKINALARAFTEG